MDLTLKKYKNLLYGEWGGGDCVHHELILFRKGVRNETGRVAALKLYLQHITVITLNPFLTCDFYVC